MNHKMSISEVVQILNSTLSPRQVWQIQMKDADWYGNSRLTFACHGKVYVVLPSCHVGQPGLYETGVKLDELQKAQMFSYLKLRADGLVQEYQSTRKSHFLDQAREFASIVYQMSDKEYQ